MRRFAIVVLAWLASLACPVGAGERSVVSFVPAEAFLEVYYDGAHPGFKDTPLAKFLQEPEVQEALRRSAPLGEFFRTKFNEGAGGDLATPFLAFTGCEAAFALLRPAEPKGQPVGLLVARVGTGESPARREAERLLRDAMAKAAPGSVRQSEIGGAKVTSLNLKGEARHIAFDGPFVLAVGDEATLRRALDPAAAKAAWPKGEDRPVLGARVATSGPLVADGASGPLAPTLMEALGGQMPAEVRKALDAVGLGAVRSVSLALIPRGARLVTQFDIEMAEEAKRAGLAKWFADCPPFDAELLKMVPSKPTLFWLTQMDIPGLWDAVWASVEGADPKGAAEGRKGLAELEQKLGVKLREELLGSLGRGTLLVAASDDGWLGGYTVLVQRVRDGKALEQGLARLVPRLDGLLEELGGNDWPARVSLKAFTYRGHSCHYISLTGPAAVGLPGFAPCYTSLGETFVFAAHPLSLKSYLDFVEDKAPSVMEDPELKSLRAVVPEGATSLSYGSWPDAVVSLYNTLAPIFMALQGPEEGQDLPKGIDLADLPSSRLLRRYARPAVVYSVFQNGRYRMEAQGDGLGILSPQVAPLAGLAIVAGVALPAIAESRTQARLVQNRSNLRQLGLGCSAYLDQFGDGRSYPASLGELLDRKIVGDKRVFVSPFDDDPPKLKNGLPCSYEFCFDKYPTRQFPDDFPGNMIIGWDRKAFVPGKRSALFFDFHVEIMDEARFERLLRELDEAVKKQTKERPPAPKKGEI